MSDNNNFFVKNIGAIIGIIIGLVLSCTRLYRMVLIIGAIIGGAIAILILLTNLYKLIVAIILICLGIFIGNYVQRNKVDVKEKLKQFIDRI